MTNSSERPFVLCRRGNQVLLRYLDGEDETPVRVVYVRPFSGAGEVSLLAAEAKRELALIRDPAALDDASRRIVEEQLKRRYFLPKITRVTETRAHFGNRYWTVETDCGPRVFLMKNPQTNVNWLSQDRCILHDTVGNCYEIESFAKLDPKSRAEAAKIL